MVPDWGWSDELRRVADHAAGFVDIVADPARLAEDFRSIIENAMGKGHGPRPIVRVWAPRGARVRLVKQVSPSMLELTDRRTEAGPAARGLPARLVGRGDPRVPHRG